MTTATMTELVERPGEIIQRVLAGASVKLTSYGRHVATISPPGGAENVSSQGQTEGSRANAVADGRVNRRQAAHGVKSRGRKSSS